MIQPGTNCIHLFDFLSLSLGDAPAKIDQFLVGKTGFAAIGSSVAALTSFAKTSFAMGSDHAAGDWWTPLDHYCERVDVGFWAEPLNALTSIHLNGGSYNHSPTAGRSPRSEWRWFPPRRCDTTA